MEQYRYQIFDNEPTEPDAPTPLYTRILRGCYSKGAEVGKKGDSRPPNPYKRSDYQLAWENGFDDGFLSTTKGQEEYRQQYDEWVNEIPF